MTHLEAIEAFSDYSAGALTPSRQEQVDRHVAECESCRAAYALLSRTLLPGPAPQRVTADPYLPTRIRAIVGQRPAGRRLAPVLRWSFASVALGAALVLGILLGQDISSVQRSDGSTSSDLVSEFASSLSNADLGDRWFTVVSSEGGTQQ